MTSPPLPQDKNCFVKTTWTLQIAGLLRTNVANVTPELCKHVWRGHWQIKRTEIDTNWSLSVIFEATQTFRLSYSSSFCLIWNFNSSVQKKFWMDFNQFCPGWPLPIALQNCHFGFQKMHQERSKKPKKTTLTTCIWRRRFALRQRARVFLHTKRLSRSNKSCIYVCVGQIC